MPKVEFDRAVAAILEQDQRFAPEAYALVRDALNHTLEHHSREQRGETTHLRGPELLQGFRNYLLKQYGPMVPTILESWGITRTKDVGEIVFHLIAQHVFSQSDDDRIEDFENVYDFHTAFVAPFLPSGASPLSQS
jgi:uncharacterized repeat protein (TIGR04138 family)